MSMLYLILNLTTFKTSLMILILNKWTIQVNVLMLDDIIVFNFILSKPDGY